MPNLHSARELDQSAFCQYLKRVVLENIDLEEIGEGEAAVDKGRISRWISWASVIMPGWYNVFDPLTSGNIAIDEKYVKVRGRWNYLLITIDIESFDILHLNLYQTNRVEAGEPRQPSHTM